MKLRRLARKLEAENLLYLILRPPSNIIVNIFNPVPEDDLHQIVEDVLNEGRNN